MSDTVRKIYTGEGKKPKMFNAKEARRNIKKEFVNLLKK